MGTPAVGSQGLVGVRAAAVKAVAMVMAKAAREVAADSAGARVGREEGRTVVGDGLEDVVVRVGKTARVGEVWRAAPVVAAATWEAAVESMVMELPAQTIRLAQETNAEL